MNEQNTKPSEPVRLSANLTGVILGILGVIGYSISDANAALIGQVIAFVVPVVLNYIAGEMARAKVSPTDR